MFRSSLLFFLLLGCVPYNSYCGGPWAQAQWKGYTELSGISAFSTVVLDVSIQSYTELGLGKNLTAKLIVPSKYMSTELSSADKYLPNNFPTGSIWGPGNIVVGLRYQILQKKITLGAGIDVWARTLRRDDLRGLRTGYDKWGFRPTLSIGQGYEKGYWYADVYADIGTNNYSEGMGLILEGGWKKEKFYLSAYMQYVQSFYNNNFYDLQPAPYRETGFFRDQETYMSFGPKFGYTIKNGWGVNAALYRIFVLTDGSGIVSGQLGIFKKW